MFLCWTLQKEKITNNKKEDKKPINKDNHLSSWDNFRIEKISTSTTLWEGLYNYSIRLNNKHSVPINRKSIKKLNKIIKFLTTTLDLNSNKSIIKAIDTAEPTKVKENSIMITLDINKTYRIPLTQNIIL